MKVCLLHKRQSTPVILEERDVYVGGHRIIYTLVFSPRSGVFEVSVVQEGGTAVTAPLGQGAAAATALFETLVTHGVAPCHVSDVILDLLCE